MSHSLYVMQVIASSSHNADLLAAMRGAGTVFGVVTDLVFKAHNVSGYHGGFILFADDTNCTNFRSESSGRANSVIRQ